MGSTSAGGDGIEFSLAPEQRVRDAVADQWQEQITKLRTEGRNDLAEDFAALLPKSRGGFDIGETGNLPPLSVSPVVPNLNEPIHAQPAFTGSRGELQLQPEHLTLRPEAPAHLQDHGFRTAQDEHRGAFRHDPIETARERIHQLRDVTPLIEEREDFQPSAKGGGIFSQPLQRIGTELGEKAAADEAAAVGREATVAGGITGSSSLGLLGKTAAGVFLAQQAGGIAESIISNPLSGAADMLMNPGQARHGSVKQIIDAAQTEGLENFTIAGRSRDWFRRQDWRGILIAPGLFPPSQNHN